MFDSVHHMVTELTPLLEHYGYFILAITIAIEGFGIPAPGQSFLIVAILLAITGQLSLTAVFIVAFISAYLGNLLGYGIGLKFGDILLAKNWIKPKTEKRLQQFIQRYGLIALIISRYIEGLKQYLSIGCGIAKMPLSKFLLGNILATMLWLAIFGLGAIFLQSQLLHLIAIYHQHKQLAFLAVIFLLIMLILCGLYYFKKTSK